MSLDFLQLFQSDPAQGFAALALSFVIYLFLGLLPTCGVVYVFYFLVTLPMRRNERARLFLDLLELGLKEGSTPEAAITRAAATHDRSLGVRFHLLATYLEQGYTLGQAVQQVPRVLPQQIRAMLRTGERIGDMAKVLPACRQLLRDGISQVRGALNYLLILAFAITPAMVFIPLVIRFKILPAFNAVFEGMLEGAALPEFTRFVFASNDVWTVLQISVICLLWLALIAYIGGPRLHDWLHRVLPGTQDWFLGRLPWRRKRLQRDFSSMLAVLLDAEVPEADAVALAAESTANLTFARNAIQARSLLTQGVKLPEAIRAIDGSGELHWRLSNALRSGRGFLRALAGWHDALDAKAFQLEQTAAQLATTLLVLFNGFVVASVVIAMFLVFIKLINEATLW